MDKISIKLFLVFFIVTDAKNNLFWSEHSLLEIFELGNKLAVKDLLWTPSLIGTILQQTFQKLYQRWTPAHFEIVIFRHFLWTEVR